MRRDTLLKRWADLTLGRRIERVLCILNLVGTETQRGVQVRLDVNFCSTPSKESCLPTRGVQAPWFS